MPSLPETHRNDRAKELRKSIDDGLDALAKAVDETRASAEFRAYLDVQARFHRYSWHNAMLILRQCPDASRVAGFQNWKKLGRYVRKGEHGIRILAPCPFKKTVADDDGAEQTIDGAAGFQLSAELEPMALCLWHIDAASRAAAPASRPQDSSPLEPINPATRSP